jgi:hypothetical protein
VEAEEAMLYVPGFDEGLAVFEESGDPGGIDMGIERTVKIVDHPENGGTCLGLAEVIAVASLAHILD